MAGQARVKRGRLCLLLFLIVITFSGVTSAHDLEVDTLAIQLDSDSTRFSGQLFLDPELTRPGEAASSIEEERARVLSFVTDHITLYADGSPLQLSLEIRELYEKGGAVPGDSVIYKANLPRKTPTLSVSIRKPLEKLATTVTVDQAPEPTLLVVGSDETQVFQGPAKDSATERHESTPTPSPPILRQIAQYVWIGFVHIVPLGWDHILFVLALTIGTLAFRKAHPYRTLLLELSAFTLAHTSTLALGALRIVEVPGSVVEPLIAFSIAAMAAEHLFLKERLGVRFPLVAFFGLVHGLGFAGALHELGLSGSHFVLFLASFNVGVELGQILIVLAAAVLLSVVARKTSFYDRATNWASIAIAAVGLSVGIWRIVEASSAN